MTDVFKKHQKAVARRTLEMSDDAIFILGGMSKEEARDILKE